MKAPKDLKLLPHELFLVMVRYCEKLRWTLLHTVKDPMQMVGDLAKIYQHPGTKQWIVIYYPGGDHAVQKAGGDSEYRMIDIVRLVGDDLKRQNVNMTEFQKGLFFIPAAIKQGGRNHFILLVIQDHTYISIDSMKAPAIQEFSLRESFLCPHCAIPRVDSFHPPIRRGNQAITETWQCAYLVFDEFKSILAGKQVKKLKWEDIEANTVAEVSALINRENNGATVEGFVHLVLSPPAHGFVMMMPDTSFELMHCDGDSTESHSPNVGGSGCGLPEPMEAPPQTEQQTRAHAVVRLLSHYDATTPFRLFRAAHEETRTYLNTLYKCIQDEGRPFELPSPTVWKEQGVRDFFKQYYPQAFLSLGTRQAGRMEMVTLK